MPKRARAIALLLKPLWRLALTPDVRPRNELALRAALAADRAMYRVTGGAQHESGGRSVLLLTMRGRRSGQPRSVLLTYLPHGDRLVVAASNAGRERSPAWLLNLQAEPVAEVQVGGRQLRVRTRVAEPDERAGLWPLFLALSPTYEGYQRALRREIPLVVMEAVE